jgi:hypothetical protein
VRGGLGFARLMALLVADSVSLGRRSGWGVRSRVFANAHAVERARWSKYPKAVSIEQTERKRIEKARDRDLRKMNRMMDELLAGDWP